MGLFSFIKGQFIEVIEWTDDGSGAFIHRFPAYDNAIKMGARLIVRDSQAAVFVNEGQIADVFAPGTYELSTNNLPVLTALQSWKYAFNSPFKADVYFVNVAHIQDRKWGTTNPFIVRDPEYGVVRLRAYGNYSFQVQDPARFLKQRAGTMENFTAEQMNGFFKTAIVSGVSDMLAESGIPLADLSVHYEELSQLALERLRRHFTALGLDLTSFSIENISLPEEVEQAIDRRASINIVGNLDHYMKYQSAEAIREAANHSADGLAGAGAGLGVAMAMGQMINKFGYPPEPQQAGAASANPIVAAESYCPNGHALKPEDQFCPQCGSPRPKQRFCATCGTKVEETARFCSGCGAKIGEGNRP